MFQGVGLEGIAFNTEEFCGFAHDSVYIHISEYSPHIRHPKRGSLHGTQASWRQILLLLLLCIARHYTPILSGELSQFIGSCSCLNISISRPGLSGFHALIENSERSRLLLHGYEPGWAIFFSTTFFLTLSRRTATEDPDFLVWFAAHPHRYFTPLSKNTAILSLRCGPSVNSLQASGTNNETLVNLFAYLVFDNNLALPTATFLQSVNARGMLAV